MRSRTATVRLRGTRKRKRPRDGRRSRVPKEEDQTPQVRESETDTRLKAILASLTPEEIEAVEVEAVEEYFRAFPNMRRRLETRMRDPEQRRKLVGGIVSRLLMERCGK
jgi:CRISPR/Cas system-associated endonuclease Cas1